MNYALILVPALLAGCAVVDQLESPQDTSGNAGVSNAAPPPPRTARTVEDFDTTTAESRAAASEASGGRLLGQNVASLGDPADPGFWIVTPLVDKATPGRVVLAGTDKTVEVELRPSNGGSARISLAALRVLGAPLTELATLDVFAR